MNKTACVNASSVLGFHETKGAVQKSELAGHTDRSLWQFFFFFSKFELKPLTAVHTI